MSEVIQMLRRRWASIGAAFILALGAGVLMQYVFADRGPLATLRDLALSAPEMPEDPAGPAARSAQPLPERVTTREPALPLLWDDLALSPFGFECEPKLSLNSGGGATIDVEFFAPCDQGQTVALLHLSLIHI